MLKYTIPNTRLVDMREFDAFVQEHVPMVEGAEFSIQQAYEMSNDSRLGFTAVKRELHEEELAQLDALVNNWPVEGSGGAKYGRDMPCDLETIVVKLTNDGLIEPGDYEIEIWW